RFMRCWFLSPLASGLPPTAYRLRSITHGLHQRRPIERQFIANPVAVLGDAGRTADAAEDPLTASLADRMGDRPLAVETGFLALGAHLASGKQHRVAPFADERCGVLVEPRRVAVVGARFRILEPLDLAVGDQQ